MRVIKLLPRRIERSHWVALECCMLAAVGIELLRHARRYVPIPSN